MLILEICNILGKDLSLIRMGETGKKNDIRKTIEIFNLISFWLFLIQQ